MMDGFEWDEGKREANIAERGVDFRLAARIFENPVLEAEDGRTDYGEIRYRALGHVDKAFFLVAYTWRGATRRIISAWKVGKHGKKRYTAALTRRT